MTPYRFLLGLLFLGACMLLPVPRTSIAQSYEWPEDTLVRENLEAWQDLKFGLQSSGYPRGRSRTRGRPT